MKHNKTKIITTHVKNATPLNSTPSNPDTVNSSDVANLLVKLDQLVFKINEQTKKINTLEKTLKEQTEYWFDCIHIKADWCKFFLTLAFVAVVCTFSGKIILFMWQAQSISELFNITNKVVTQTPHKG